MKILNDPLSVLKEILGASRIIARERNLMLQLKVIAESACKLASAQASCIYLLDKTQRFLVPAIQTGELFTSQKLSLSRIQLDSPSKNATPSVSAYCMYSGALVNLNDIYEYTGFDVKEFLEYDRICEQRTKSLLAVPLTDKEGVNTGVIMLFNHKYPDSTRVDEFPSDLESYVNGFAAIAAISVSNSLLLNEKQELLKQQDELNRSLIIENKELKGRIYGSLQLDKIIGRSRAMESVFQLIEKLKTSTATVFLNGETGTGKELFASVIHENSPFRKGKFVAQNCAAFPPDLLESEMFGHKKGAFSGASESKRGLVLDAHQGTLFLDEIGEMPMDLQSKLLRVLQEGEVRPVGSNETIKVNIRVIAATNRDLFQMVQTGEFREDLYYRLNVFPISLPALRERSSDIPSLIQYFVKKYNKQYSKTIKRIEPDVMDKLQLYSFPGNVRELQNIIERAVILAGDSLSISLDCLPAEVKNYQAFSESHSNTGNSVLENNQNNGRIISDELVQQLQTDEISLKSMIGHYESELIKQALHLNKGNQTATAKKLGLSRRALIDKLNKYCLNESGSV